MDIFLINNAVKKANQKRNKSSEMNFPLLWVKRFLFLFYFNCIVTRESLFCAHGLGEMKIQELFSHIWETNDKWVEIIQNFRVL